MDELGRIVLPIELRRTMDIAVRDPLEVYTAEDTVILKKHQPACVFCNNAKDVISYEGKNIWRSWRPLPPLPAQTPDPGYCNQGAGIKPSSAITKSGGRGLRFYIRFLIPAGAVRPPGGIQVKFRRQRLCRQIQCRAG